MMRYAFIVALLAALLAAACKDSEPPAKVAPSPAASTAARPEPVAPVPEGMLLVQETEPIGYPRSFGIRESEVREMTKGPLLSVSPDGRHLAAVEHDADDYRVVVRIINADGEETFVARAPEGTRSANPFFTAPLWSPDGSQVAYALPDTAGSDLTNVFAVNADGSGQREITAGAGSYSLIGWTADGRLLGYDGANLLLVGGKNETLPLPDGIRAAYGFQMSPDGRSVALTTGEDAEAQELWVLDTDSGQSRLVAKMGRQARRPRAGLYVSAGIPPGLEAADAPTAMLKGPPPVIWSPDGRRIAYYRNWTDEATVFHSELRVVNAETGEDTGVTEEGGWSAVWSPDGRYLAEPGSDHRSVVLLGPGDEVRTLDVQANRVLWSPAGRLIAVGAGSVSLVDAETGAVTEARTASGGSIAGAWGWEPARSPDGRYLALVTSEDPGRKNASMYVVDTRTAGATLVLEKGSFHPAGWLRA